MYSFSFFLFKTVISSTEPPNVSRSDKGVHANQLLFPKSLCNSSSSSRSRGDPGVQRTTPVPAADPGGIQGCKGTPIFAKMLTRSRQDPNFSVCLHMAKNFEPSFTLPRSATEFFVIFDPVVYITMEYYRQTNDLIFKSCDHKGVCLQTISRIGIHPWRK